MKSIHINTIDKTIEIETDFDFLDFSIDKFRNYFHCNFKISNTESIGFAFFYKDFGGKKYYPKELTECETFDRKVKIKYNL